MNMLRIFCITWVLFFLVGCATNKNTVCHIGIDGKCAMTNYVSDFPDNKKFYTYSLAALNGKPIRSGETIQQIWLGPYEDQDGNYHAPAYIYNIVKKSAWIGDPVKNVEG